ncbi:MAG: hypothetical protein JSW34_08690, partial [Candidatus Zixiibacteriota bacterium]
MSTMRTFLICTSSVLLTSMLGVAAAFGATGDAPMSDTAFAGLFIEVAARYAGLTPDDIRALDTAPSSELSRFS